MKRDLRRMTDKLVKRYNCHCVTEYTSIGEVDSKRERYGIYVATGVEPPWSWFETFSEFKSKVDELCQPAKDPSLPAPVEPSVNVTVQGEDIPQ